MKLSVLDRILLFLTGLLAAYQIVVGINDMSRFPIIAYTIGFGVLLIAEILLIILGFTVLESPVVVIVTTIIPLSISSGLIWEHLPSFRTLYLIFAIVGFLAILLTRSIPMQNKLPISVLAIVHGVAGVMIFLLPIFIVAQGKMKPAFVLVGIGGALISIGGLLLLSLKAGKPILSKETILKGLAGLLLLMTICFVMGFKYG